MNKLLFILKRREMTHEEGTVLYSCGGDNPYFKYCISSGLRNSAKFVVDMLNDNGIEAKLIEVIDNNCIDREVTLYKPTHVIIEAFWVVPDKFAVLQKLHPKVEWIVRNHSELPFLANEGIAIDWAIQYLKYKNVYLAPNSHKSYEDAVKIVSAAYSPLVASYKVLYLPNYYKIKERIESPPHDKHTLNVACFGAVRPLKNHLVQAVAAVKYALDHNKKLNFHINVARIEDAGNNSLKSIRGFFKHLDPTRFKLIEHGWLDHDDFLELVSQMDIGLQASFTETFNIVTADFVSQGVPIVVSEEIEWLPNYFVCEHTDSSSIMRVMHKLLNDFEWCRNFWAMHHLKKYNRDSVRIWTEMFTDYDDR